MSFSDKKSMFALEGKEEQPQDRKSHFKELSQPGSVSTQSNATKVPTSSSRSWFSDQPAGLAQFESSPFLLSPKHSVSPKPVKQQPLAVESEGSTGRITVMRKKPLGSGSFGCVYKGFDNESGMYVAVKEARVECGHAPVDDLRREYDMLKKMQHPNIVRVQDFVIDEKRGETQIIMEWMAGGSVGSILKENGFRLHEGAIRRYFAESLHGLAYLHDNGVLHRDVKPGNMLCSGEGAIKLSDFGTSRFFTRDTGCSSAHIVGTPAYIAPECIGKGKYSAASDMWALACSVVEMATCRPPWGHLPESQQAAVPLIFHIATAQPPNHHPLIPRHLSQTLRALVERCFAVIPNDRPSANDLLADSYFASQALPPDAESMQAWHDARKRNIGSAVQIQVVAPSIDSGAE